MRSPLDHDPSPVAYPAIRPEKGINLDSHICVGVRGSLVLKSPRSDAPLLFGCEFTPPVHPPSLP